MCQRCDDLLVIKVPDFQFHNGSVPHRGGEKRYQQAKAMVVSIVGQPVGQRDGEFPISRRPGRPIGGKSTTRAGTADCADFLDQLFKEQHCALRNSHGCRPDVPLTSNIPRGSFGSRSRNGHTQSQTMPADSSCLFRWHQTCHVFRRSFFYTLSSRGDAYSMNSLL
jgi:hypothetical protein